jgi:ParB family chromosome partitioning protein
MGGIDLDPATCPAAQATINATKWYTKREDGLRQPWQGRVWLNPPYSTLAPKFVARFAEHYAAGAVSQGVLLLGTHHLTTQWFGALAPLRPVACLPSTRLQFSDSTERPAHGSIILGIGVKIPRFIEEFAPLGTIWQTGITTAAA